MDDVGDEMTEQPEMAEGLIDILRDAGYSAQDILHAALRQVRLLVQEAEQMSGHSYTRAGTEAREKLIQDIAIMLVETAGDILRIIAPEGEERVLM